MKDIEHYIQQAATMENTSVGGSPSYLFGDVVLVNYGALENQYGLCREMSEQVAEQANLLNAQGVRTPRHLGIKREQVTRTNKDGTTWEGNSCWVLQETARGVPYTKYAHNKDLDVQLDMQSRIANAPDKHFEQYSRDLQALFNMGYELKPKNLFYDENVQDGGFTVIDLLGNRQSKPPFDPASTKDVLALYRDLQSAGNCGIHSYDDKASDEQRAISKQVGLRIKQKIFSALEKTIPDFEKHRRDVLRSIPQEALEYFAQNGTEVGDLTLTPQEIEKFNKTANALVDECVRQVANGETPSPGISPFGNVKYNVMGNEPRSLGLQNSWAYHPQRTIFKREDFEHERDFTSAGEKELRENLQVQFENGLELLSENNQSPAMAQAMKEMQKERASREHIKQRERETIEKGDDVW